MKYRNQKVKIKNVYSSSLDVNIGIPQGIVLGPLLFITYINSLLKLNINGDSIAHADNTVLLFKGKIWETGKEKAVAGLEMVKRWLDSSKLTLNSDKTLYIAFSMNDANRPSFTSIKMNETDITIAETNTIKYLGIRIDKNLKWNNHIQDLTNKIRSLIPKFYTIRRNII